MTTSLVRQAAASDLEMLVPLFDAYRQFYGQAPALELAREFLAERFRRADSTLLVAESAGAAQGFTQLYPSWSSVSMRRTFILNDLFVTPGSRRHGIGMALLRAAAELSRAAGALRLTLSTAVTNDAARALYESSGWVLQRDYDVYTLRL